MDFNDRRAVAQHLEAVGCARELIEEFLSCMENGRQEKALALLNAHRDSLLERIHKEERQISCVDCLIYHAKQAFAKKGKAL